MQAPTGQSAKKGQQAPATLGSRTPYTTWLNHRQNAVGYGVPPMARWALESARADLFVDAPRNLRNQQQALVVGVKAPVLAAACQDR